MYLFLRFVSWYGKENTLQMKFRSCVHISYVRSRGLQYCSWRERGFPNVTIFAMKFKLHYFSNLFLEVIGQFLWKTFDAPKHLPIACLSLQCPKAKRIFANLQKWLFRLRTLYVHDTFADFANDWNDQFMLKLMRRVCHSSFIFQKWFFRGHLLLMVKRSYLKRVAGIRVFHSTAFLVLMES